MSYEGSKRDFEKALEEMKETMPLLDHCVDDALMETLKSVVNEYEIHFQSGIEEMEDKVKELTE